MGCFDSTLNERNVTFNFPVDKKAVLEVSFSH